MIGFTSDRQKIDKSQLPKVFQCKDAVLKLPSDRQSEHKTKTKTKSKTKTKTKSKTKAKSNENNDNELHNPKWTAENLYELKDNIADKLILKQDVSGRPLLCNAKNDWDILKIYINMRNMDKNFDLYVS